jgi:hypothetical protein
MTSDMEKILAILEALEILNVDEKLLYGIIEYNCVFETTLS